MRKIVTKSGMVLKHYFLKIAYKVFLFFRVVVKETVAVRSCVRRMDDGSSGEWSAGDTECVSPTTIPYSLALVPTSTG